ncbi:hypothetical protein QDT03_17065 [Acinetobacter baumannii]|nr:MULTISPECIES: hypothetical protein [Acinetobacter calcoaceticus/baumannii complex]MDH2608292.1 hypothetical protein [Acinetobacter baumannii]MDO7421358.1 hypothetical protein [Acinetobacter baumannii]MDO7509642.1 hypothetical protein [Acinetobacter baumannii]MDO7534176.1 hypothetical protein [Acinetobacter pittii]
MNDFKCSPFDGIGNSELL